MDGAVTGIDANIARVADWIARCGLSTAEIARRAEVDHKTVRLARQPGWNPTADVLRKFEQLIPEDWPSGPRLGAASPSRPQEGAAPARPVRFPGEAPPEAA